MTGFNIFDANMDGHMLMCSWLWEKFHLSILNRLFLYQSLVKVPGRKSRKRRRRRRRPQQQQQQNGAEEERGEQDEEKERNSGDEEYDGDDYEEDEEGQRVRKPKPMEVTRQSESDSESDLEDADAVMERLPDDAAPLLDFARASQGILLLLVLKQHLKNLYGFSDR